MIIGVISDTHGTLNSDAVDALNGVHRIIHAGDIDGPEVLKALESIAPVTAVRGNMDSGSWAQKLPIADLVDYHGVNFYILHNLYTLDLDPIAAGIQVIISGHTHQPEIRTDKGILFFNPGSASYSRHGEGLSIGRIELDANGVHAHIIRLS